MEDQLLYSNLQVYQGSEQTLLLQSGGLPSSNALLTSQRFLIEVAQMFLAMSCGDATVQE